ncbi:MATE family efflux transporter [Clostridium paraputrificum]|uniref:MATE family efflux transporter n=1 Tax=Clostridium TaxID=1485 RepID=UPI003D349828
MKKVDLTKGKVISVLTLLALPIIGSSLLQFTYNLIDMLWVGGLGSDAVASIGSSSFFIGLGYSINALVITGTGIKVAHSVGKKDNLEVRKYINAGLIINTVIGVIYAASLIIIGKEFIGFLNLNNYKVEKDAYMYLAVSGPTMYFTFANLLYTRILSSFGNSKTALKISGIGIIINIVLDPIFIYIFKLGVIGAAIATLIANIVMFIIFKLNSHGTFKFDKTLGIDGDKIKEIIKLGFPMSFQRVLFTITGIILARIIAQFGSDAIAAQKIGLQIESITLMVIGGLNGAVASFTGQNFGAGMYSRLQKGYHIALKIGIGYNLVMAIVFIFFNIPLIELFVRDKETILIASAYLKIIAVSQIFGAIEVVTNGFFTGLGKPNISATVSIIFTVLRIPMALVFIKFLGLNGVWISISLSSILKGSVVYLVYVFNVRKEYRNVK